MFARLVAARPTVSLASAAAVTSTSTTTHTTHQHARAFSFFSSKSGGGGEGSGGKYKYFTANSSSSRRSSPPNGANGNGGNGGAASSKPKMDGNTTTTTAVATTVGTARATETADTTPSTTAKSQPPEDPTKKGDSPPSVTVSPSSSSSTSNPTIPGQRWTTSWQPQPVHAPLTAKDFNLHSFFSGHRPLLLLSQPSSSVFNSWSDLQLSNTPNPEASRHQSLLSQLGGINLEDPPEATPEEDADAARLLNRALVVNRLGGAVSWEETLAKLGVEERSSLAEMEMGAHDVVDVGVSMGEFDVYMDSTKRKRKKKMKKHKLKKRRRLQRSQRIKIGK